ncbi:FGGY-family carbohydrate kinase [Eubacterium sp. AB3007]|uniref:xylulokinase n=1 Tax=Eubacterium sp. AB3007 TaxID=1392487 RepID=UPI000557B9D0|nr:FGGY-family carbohydrate kinase [Eubacterium sp. AB3007]
MAYILAYDIGTTGVKTCLFDVDDCISLVADASQGYPLYVLENGGAEQDAEDWWRGMCESTKEVLRKSGVECAVIRGLSFCSQMQGLVLVDREGNPVRRPMSYMDQRSGQELTAGIAHGVQIAGANVRKLLPSLWITGAVSSSVKDPVWKYKWVEAHEPELFRKVYKWLDVKDYLISRCTGNFTMTRDSAFGTLLYDNRPEHGEWSARLCSMFGVDREHLPEIIDATDVAGALTKQAAAELGLAPGTPVFGGGGDSSLIGVGAGSVEVGDTHIYSGTSGWVITVMDHRMVDVKSMIAAITGAQEGRYNYFAEMETAGKCLEWVRDHLALDEIGIYLKKKDVSEGYEAQSVSLYDYMMETIREVPPGSGGVLFAPWLHGNRCPFEDAGATGMFLGIRLETGKTEMIRAVLEGVFYHLRWMLECQERKVKTSDPVRFVGGGALSPVACQMLADILGRRVETVERPQNVGSVGAAAVASVGLGLIPTLDAVKSFVPVAATYVPDPARHEAYEPYYKAFRSLYPSNKVLFHALQCVRRDGSF